MTDTTNATVNHHHGLDRALTVTRQLPELLRVASLEGTVRERYENDYLASLEVIKATHHDIYRYRLAWYDAYFLWRAGISYEGVVEHRPRHPAITSGEE